MKTTSLLISAMLITAFTLSHSAECSQSFGLSLVSPSTNRLLYLASHASILHLAINIYAFLTLAFVSRATSWQMCAAIFIAVTIPAAFLSKVPMVGFSTIIYALSGMCLLKSSGWKSLVICNLLLIGAQSLFAGFAVLPHLYCFCAGCSIGFLFTPRFDSR